MIIIVESGATKTDWCAISENGNIRTLRTEGMNLSIMASDKVGELTNKAVYALNVDHESVSEMHFYAAGQIDSRSNGSVEYASDLLGAARSVCGHNPGIAVILGTGSNSCFYDGENIVKNVRSGGFILGDEGSAANLGKLFVADFLKGLVPEDIAQEFQKEFTVDYPTVVRNVYRGETPSRYLGDFAPWIIKEYGKNDYITDLVDNNFRSFFKRVLLQYDVDNYSVGVVGGFAVACKEMIEKISVEFGIRISSIVESPMDGLIAYHRK